MSDREEQSKQKAVAAAVRTASRSIVQRLGEAPDPEELTEDQEFLRVAQLLADEAVPFQTCALLARTQTAVTAAIAHRGIALRTEAPEWWLRWAFTQLKRVYAAELCFLLEAI